MKNRLITKLAILILAAFGAVNASAQYDDQSQAPPPPEAAQQPLEQPPYGQQPNRQQAPSGQGVDVSPGVARISLTQGEVSTQRGDSGEWAAAVLNAPIVTGDKISTGDNSRAEVQLDYANMLRLGDRAQAIIANMTRNQIQVQIAEGIANYDVFKGSDSDAEIDTPNVAIHPNRAGASFRIIVNSNDESEVLVRRGDVQISTPQGSTQVGQGQLITIHGTGNDTGYKVADAPPSDDWDSWINERNNRIENAKSWNHTDRYYTGSEDLDSYGQWKDDPGYGAVWVPTQGPDWAPYRDGRWTWEPYYGWTWVPSEPWGWAPYHYGRWMYYDSAWAWWPGPVYGAPYYRPVWAPAYVSFFGFGGGGFGVGVGVGFGYGSFGWLPLGPGDWCHPWWGGYRNGYNVTNINNVNIYNNRGGEWGGYGPLRHDGISNVHLAGTNDHIRGGVSSVPAGSFGTGRIAARPVDAGLFRNGHMMTGNLPVVPSHESLSASNRPASVSTIRGGQQHFFGTSHSNNMQSFDRQASQVQQSIQSNSHFSPVRSGGGENLRAQNGSTNSARPTESNIPSGNSGAKPSPEVRPQGNENGRNTGNSNNGFSRFGSPQTQNGGNQSTLGGHNNVPRPPSAQNENSRSAGSNQNGSTQNGWHSFSEPNNSRGNSGTNGSFNNNSGSHNNVARPSGSNTNGSSTPYFGNRSESRPSPSNNGNNSSQYRSFGNSRESNSPSSNSPGSSGSRNVPRPPSSYSNGGNTSNGGDYRSFGGSSSRGSVSQPSSRGGYSGGGSYPSRATESPSYGGGSYPSSRGASPSYGGGSYPSSRGASPSYGGGSYPSSRGSSPSYSAPAPSSRSYSRPPLDMRQPIVGGRSSGSSGGSYAGSRGGASYAAPRGGSYGGGSSSHGSSGSSHGGGSPHSGGRGR